MPAIPNPKLPRSAAPVFAALGDPTRLGLVDRLGHQGPMSISRLTEGTRLTRQAVTKHLQVMERARLVRSTRQGRERLWHLEQGRVDQARLHLDRISARWESALSRLRNYVERNDTPTR